MITSFRMTASFRIIASLETGGTHNNGDPCRGGPLWPPHPRIPRALREVMPKVGSGIPRASYKKGNLR
jgi:hypothetical protein